MHELISYTYRRCVGEAAFIPGISDAHKADSLSLLSAIFGSRNAAAQQLLDVPLSKGLNLRDQCEKFVSSRKGLIPSKPIERLPVCDEFKVAIVDSIKIARELSHSNISTAYLFASIFRTNTVCAAKVVSGIQKSCEAVAELLIEQLANDEKLRKEK